MRFGGICQRTESLELNRGDLWIDRDRFSTKWSALAELLEVTDK